MPPRSLDRLMAAAALALLSAIAGAAEVDPAQYASLAHLAARQGYAPVLVTLSTPVSLARVKTDGGKLRQTLETQATILRSELGSGAFDGGYWNNGLGQIGLYVTQRGLESLKASNRAKAFTTDDTRGMRVIVHDADGSLNAIERQLSALGYADVEIFPNIETAYDIGSDGASTFRPSGAIAQSTSSKVQTIMAATWAKGLQGIDQSPTGQNRPSFTARIDRNAFSGLRESVDVRAIRPLNFQDQRSAKWDPDIVSVAYEKGRVELLLSLRGAPTFSPRTGYMSSGALAVQKAAHGRAFDQILRNAGIATSSVMRRMEDVGTLHLRLTPAEATALVAAADSRVLSAQISRPSASPSLSNSTTLLNVGPAWSAGLIGTGQWVVILDSGVRSSHLMLGSSRVPYEFCFGTNESPYSSICPNPQGTSGDSPSPYAGSAQPYSNATYCAANPGTCEHGTHVAGIAAGIPAATTPNAFLPGMAQGASVAAMQVLSYPGNGEPRAFEADLLVALDTVYWWLK